MKYKLLLGLFVGIFLIPLVISLPLYVKPLDGSGNLQASTSFDYVFNFTTNIDCTGVVLSNESTIVTEKDGVGFVDIDVSEITSVPSYLCEYVDGEYRTNHTLSDQLFKDVYARDINITGNLSLGEKITFTLGEIIDNIVDGWIRITGGLNVTQNLSVDVNTLFVDSNNNRVGIGTTAPSEKLEVSGNVVVSSGINIGDIINAPVAGGLRLARVSTNEPFLLFENDGGNNALSQVRGVNGGGLRITTGDSVTTWLQILNNGNIGIGTTTPTEKLSVVGNASVSGTLYVLGQNISAINTDTWVANFSSYYTSSEVDDINTSMKNYVDAQDIVFNTTMVNYVGEVNTSMANYVVDYVGIQNTSLVNYIGVQNTSLVNYISVVNTSMKNYVDSQNSTLGGYDSSFFMPLNTSVYDDFDFNGGWGSGGFSIIGGDIYAQKGWFYDISSLEVSTLSINGSILPHVDFDNQFDLGNASLRWRNLNVGTDAIVGGKLNVSGNVSVDTSVLFVDSDNNRVGIGTTTPGKKLDVNGAIRTDDQFISTVATGTSPLAVTSTTLVTNLNADRLDSVEGSVYYKDSDVIMNTNPFGGRRLFINTFNNAFFRADKRWTVTGNYYYKSDDSLYGAVSAADLRDLFDGNYESYMIIPATTYAKININFSSESSGWYPGYPYGYFYVSHYYTYFPDAATTDTDTLRAYCNYEPHGIGWHEFTISDFLRTSFLITKTAHQNKYAISQFEFKLNANDTDDRGVSQIDWQLDRPGTNEMPFVDKFKSNILYDALNFESGTSVTKISLNPAGSSYFDGGNVGIGTASPASKLNVAGVLGIGGNSGSISNTGLAIELSTDTVFGGVNDNHTGIRMFAYDMDGWETAKLGIQVSNTWAGYIGDDSPAKSDMAMVIGQSETLIKGNVGIGTTSPTLTLDVDGSGMIGYNLWGKESVSVNSTVFATLTHVNGSTLNSNYHYRISLVVGGTGTDTGAQYLVWYDADTTAWNVRNVSRMGSSSNHPEIFLDSGTPKIKTSHASLYTVKVVKEAMYSGNSHSMPAVWGASYMWQRDVSNLFYIDGDVGIGTTSPGSHLELGGTGKTDGLSFEGGGYMYDNGTALILGRD